MTQSTDASHGYEAVALQFLAGRGQAKDSIGAAQVRAWARRLPPGTAVLDLGCGSGIPISQVLKEEGLVPYGIDASPTMAAAFHANFPTAPLLCEPAETSSFFGRSFDAVLSWGLMFLLAPDTQRTLLNRMAQAVAPGGGLLFTSPALVCSWEDGMTGEPSYSIGAEAYREILHSWGLRVIAEYEDEGENHYYDAIAEVQ